MLMVCQSASPRRLGINERFATELVVTTPERLHSQIKQHKITCISGAKLFALDPTLD